MAVKIEPWYTGWELLISSSYAQSTYTSHSVVTIYRGDDDDVHTKNYAFLYEDSTVDLLNSSSSTFKLVAGDPDQWLATSHATLDFTLASVLAQQAYNQGTNLPVFFIL